MSRAGRLAGLAIASALLAPLSVAHAEAAPPPEATFEVPNEDDLEASLLPKPLRHARWSALVDGGWSVLMTLSWMQSARIWRGPQPDGVLSLLAARVLYGTTNSVLLATELSLFTYLFEDDWGRLSHGRFRNEWWVGLATPSGCQGSPDAQCGLGLGASSELTVRVDGELELAHLSGWVQGRLEADDARTVLESTWFQGPFVARWVHTFGEGPVRLTTALGGGLFFGLRVAHAREHGPRPEGAFPIELIVLDGGLGVGVSSRARLELGSFELTLDVDLVPLFGASRARPPARARPVFAESGVPVWRHFALGLGFPPISGAPVRLSARVGVMELSARPLTQLGHWVSILAFEVPFVLEPDDDVSR